MVEVTLPFIVCVTNVSLGDLATAASDDQQSDEISERVSDLQKKVQEL